MLYATLDSALHLPCGAVMKNRLVKSPMSDSLGNGKGDPSAAQIRLYEQWAQGGAALSVIGEAQVDQRYPEKPGNLVLGLGSNRQALQELTRRATVDGAHLWPQLGHAGALAHAPISTAKGPSRLNLKDLQCEALSIQEIQRLPSQFAQSARLAQDVGFTGVLIHAGHGFLLSQFLSPLFNQRTDDFGGSIENRSRIILQTILAVRLAVGPSFPVGIRINSSDLLEGGLTESDALQVINMLDNTSIDLIDISGGTYFPGAPASSDGNMDGGAYFLSFAQQAKQHTTIPLILTGGFKRQVQAVNAMATGSIDMVGVARAMILNPKLPLAWLQQPYSDPEFPRFQQPPAGGVTAWYSMALVALGEANSESSADRPSLDLSSVLNAYEARDVQRCQPWLQHFLAS